ncbi:hypothetical protein Tco_0414468, partial [Tanacetum coccineum]
MNNHNMESLVDIASESHRRNLNLSGIVEERSLSMNIHSIVIYWQTATCRADPQLRLLSFRLAVDNSLELTYDLHPKFIAVPNQLYTSTYRSDEDIHLSRAFIRAETQPYWGFGYEVLAENVFFLIVDQSIRYGVSADMDTAYSSKSGNGLEFFKVFRHD